MFDLNSISFTRQEIKKEIILPKDTSTELAYLSGFLCGDGSLNIRPKKYEYSIKIVGNPKDEILFYNIIIAPLFKKLFNAIVTPRLFDGNTTYGIRIYSKSLFTFFTKIIGIPFSYKSGKVKIPKVFMKNNKLTCNFIQGFADADFCLSIHKGNYPVISSALKSKTMILQIAEFLKNKGINCSVNLDYVRYDPRMKEGKTIENQIYINGRKNLHLWMQFIGSKMPKFLAKYKLFLNN